MGAVESQQGGKGQGEIRRRAQGLGGAQEVGAGGLFGLMGGIWRQIPSIHLMAFFPIRRSFISPTGSMRPATRGEEGSFGARLTSLQMGGNAPLCRLVSFLDPKTQPCTVGHYMSGVS